MKTKEVHETTESFSKYVFCTIDVCSILNSTITTLSDSLNDKRNNNSF